MAKLHAQIENIGFEEAVNNITGSTLGKSLSSSLEETFDEVDLFFENFTPKNFIVYKLSFSIFY